MSPIGPKRIARSRRPGRRAWRLRVATVTLSLVSAATFGSLIYGWHQAREHVIDVGIGDPVDPSTKVDVVVNDLHYDGRDDRGRPFSITAVSASHTNGDDRHISLKKPLADITTSSGAYVALAANDSILDRDAGLMSLSGDVTLFQDTGLSFQTDRATVDLRERTAEGDDVVEGQNGDGELISQGFRVRDDGDTIEFTGKAYMTIYPKQKNQEGQGG
jgi:lipopolysaccharide export system protein LptC